MVERVVERHVCVHRTTVLVVEPMILVRVAAFSRLALIDVASKVAPIYKPHSSAPVTAAVQRPRIAPEPMVTHPPRVCVVG